LFRSDFPRQFLSTGVKDFPSAEYFAAAVFLHAPVTAPAKRTPVRSQASSFLQVSFCRSLQLTPCRLLHFLLVLLFPLRSAPIFICLFSTRASVRKSLSDPVASLLILFFFWFHFVPRVQTRFGRPSSGLAPHAQCSGCSVSKRGGHDIVFARSNSSTMIMIVFSG
jgi:hypothetical protein